MNTPTKLSSAILLALGIAVPCAQAATPPRGSLLTINAGTTSSSVFVTGSGSYFGMDTNGNAKIANSEKVIVSQGTTGLVIGTTTSAGASHIGAPTAGDTNAIDDPWNFFGNTGSDYLRTAATGSTTAGLNFSGWTVTWNGIPAINMGTGAWATGTGLGHTGATGTFTNGIANFSWNGTNGGAYSLDYRATVPAGDPSGFGNVKYELHLEGVITNDAPTAAARTVNSLPGGTSNWTPGAADPNPTTGVANTTLTCSISAQPANGTATVAANCSSGTYTHDGGGSTTDSFTYIVSDGLSSSAPATVSVNISADPPPTTTDFSANAVGTNATSIDFSSVVTDPVGAPDWTTLSVTCASGAGIVNNNDGTVTYTGVAGFAGIDACSFSVTDDNGGTSNSSTASVSVYASVAGSGSGTFSGGRTTTVPADADVGAQCIGGCLDFTVSGVGVGEAVQVVLPLTTAIPAGALYRKYDDGAWENFLIAGGNSYASAALTTVAGQSVCPPAGSPAYIQGNLTQGHQCLQVTIVDGSDYDADATPGQVADPSGIATPAAVAVAASGSGGCTLATARQGRAGVSGDWLLVGAAMAGLGLFRRRVF